MDEKDYLFVESEDWEITNSMIFSFGMINQPPMKCKNKSGDEIIALFFNGICTIPNGYDF